MKDIDSFVAPYWAYFAEVQADTADIRYTLDGSIPSTTEGLVLTANAMPYLLPIDEFKAMKFTRGGGSNAQLNVHFIPRSEP